MIATFPAVQAELNRIKRYCCMRDVTYTKEKRIANRRHRRALNRATRRMGQDPERWWNEGFNAPTLSSRDLW